MKTSVAVFALVAAAGNVLAGTDVNNINSFLVDNRAWNDWNNSTLHWGPAGAATNLAPLPTDDGVLPSSGGVEWRDEFAANSTGQGGYANKHVAWFSDDGVNRHQGNKNQSWTMNFDVKIDVAAPGVRREAGVEVRNPRPALGYTDEGQLLIGSDGEVAIFGGVMPFTGLGNVYTAGTTAHVTWEYFAPGTADPVLGAYQLTFTDAVTGVHSSGMKFWGAGEPDGLFGFNFGTEMGFKAQNQRIPPIDDFSDITYSNFSMVPAPSAIALMGMAGLVAGRRRR